MIGIGTGWVDMEIYDQLTKHAMDRIRERLENAPENKLREIVKDYNSKPWYKKIFFTIESNESELEYLCARDTLLGTFSWSELDEMKRKTREESERIREESEKMKRLIEEGKKIKRFDGNLQELENYTGKRYKILSERRVYNSEFEFLGKLNTEWLVNAKDYSSGIFIVGYTGIPVREIGVKKTRGRKIV